MATEYGIKFDNERIEWYGVGGGSRALAERLVVQYGPDYGGLTLVTREIS